VRDAGARLIFLSMCEADAAALDEMLADTP
jgi:hypothetical protein